jgi:hypothetical protein
MIDVAVAVMMIIIIIIISSSSSGSNRRVTGLAAGESGFDSLQGRESFPSPQSLDRLRGRA